jgi:hypothetical protein
VSGPSPAERLDRALDALLAERPMVAEPALRTLVETAEKVRLALGPVPVSPRFEARLATRVARARHSSWPDLHVPTWLLVTGAASSAALGVGVTAFAVWRGAHRAGSR